MHGCRGRASAHSCDEWRCTSRAFHGDPRIGNLADIIGVLTIPEAPLVFRVLTLEPLGLVSAMFCCCFMLHTLEHLLAELKVQVTSRHRWLCVKFIWLKVQLV